MLTCDRFTYAAAPRTGVEWFTQAATLAGFALQGGNAHVPPPQDHNALVVTVVRHPYDWLVSLFMECKSKRREVGNLFVDGLITMAGNYCITLDDFIRAYITYCPGEVGLMFDSYNASTVMRLEDQPFAACDFFDPFGVDVDRLIAIEALPPCNCRVGLPVLPNFNLRSLVVRAEREFCQRYDYS